MGAAEIDFNGKQNETEGLGNFSSQWVHDNCCNSVTLQSTRLPLTKNIVSMILEKDLSYGLMTYKYNLTLQERYKTH